LKHLRRDASRPGQGVQSFQSDERIAGKSLNGKLIVDQERGTGFDSLAAERRLKERFEVATLDGFGQFDRAALCAAGGLLSYLDEVARDSLPFLRPPVARSAGDHMMIDAATRESLELTAATGGGRAGSLLHAVDRTVASAYSVRATPDARVSTPLLWDEVAGPIRSSDEWIVSRSGITSRGYAGPAETLLDMAAAAAGKALGEAGLPPGEVSLVLVTTMSNLRQAPPLAAELAFRIGATDAGALDTGAGCAGFCYTLAVAADAIRSGSARHVVVVGVERMTDIVDPTDRGTAFLFGDGAGAVVVGPAAEPGVGPVRWGSDGSKAAGPPSH